ncbi:hypothetical protein [Bacillus sp. JCM 19041]|uniref:hypothetical protein n=1 Tax=Bacillus sp. JCM 19041 TaxID=1460637 RepID=UPI00336A37FB
MKTAVEAIEWIHSLLPFGIKPGLKRMEWMLEALYHPEKGLHAVHIAGTNGKGSTVALCAIFSKKMVGLSVHLLHLILNGLKNGYQ